MAKTTDLEKGRGLAALSTWPLRDAYEDWHRGWPKKLAAEVAFALALAIKRAGDAMGPGFADKKKEYRAMARGYAAECVVLLTGHPAETREDIAPSHTTLAGVTLPGYFYLTYLTSLVFVVDKESRKGREIHRFPDFVELLG